MKVYLTDELLFSLQVLSSSLNTGQHGWYNVSTVEKLDVVVPACLWCWVHLFYIPFVTLIVMIVTFLVLGHLDLCESFSIAH